MASTYKLPRDADQAWPRLSVRSSKKSRFPYEARNQEQDAMMSAFCKLFEDSSACSLPPDLTGTVFQSYAVNFLVGYLT